MGPRARDGVGKLVPAVSAIWQDPIPDVDHPLIDANDADALKTKILASGLDGAAVGFDRMGIGLVVPPLRQARWREWCAYPSGSSRRTGGSIKPAQLKTVLAKLEEIQKGFGKKVSPPT